jgi:phosphodiesterase/alkaline phosphatase D-like protein
VNPQGAEVTVCEFEYGTTPALGSKIACSSLPGNGESGVRVTAEVSGLGESTVYYYRAVATNEDGTKFGNTVKFSTYPSAPKVAPLAATHITSDSAQLNANVNPDASSVTTCEFEWGTSVAYGNRAACSELPGEGESPVAVSATLHGLSGSTTYDYRIVAKNAHGTSFGQNVKFVTPVAGQRPTVTKLSPTHGYTTGGTTVKIKGTGFTENTTVLFGSVAATSVTVKNGDQLVVVSPSESVGPVQVTVTTDAGTSEETPADVFTYKEKKP